MRCAIIGSVSLRLSFDAIAVNDLVGTSAKDDAERWCAMEVAGLRMVSLPL
jgi:hypothetical protein